MKNKTLLSEAELVRKLNEAIAAQWPHADRTCCVESLKKRHGDGSNWEVDIDSTGGRDLMHAAECDTLRKRIVEAFAAQYDVRWPSSA